ncbi:MAG: FtsL-like putative cell division protein [Vicingaceae bacterium]
MNRLKKDIEKEQQPKSERSSKSVKGVKDVLSGNFLSKESVVNVLPYVFFLTFLGICYIANGYQAEKLVRRLYKTTNEIKELRSEYITNKSDLMYISKQSQVARATKSLGLRELMSPPKKIVISEDEKEEILND